MPNDVADLLAYHVGGFYPLVEFKQSDESLPPCMFRYNGVRQTSRLMQPNSGVYELVSPEQHDAAFDGALESLYERYRVWDDEWEIGDAFLDFETERTNEGWLVSIDLNDLI
jgi:hypothetical protein